jgi:hypothetical protein
LISEALQNKEASTQPLQANVAVTLTRAYTQMHTVMAVGAYLHKEIFLNGRELFTNPSGVLADKDLNCLSPKLFSMFRMLNSALSTLGGWLSHESLVSADSSGFRLKEGIGYCCLWKKHVGIFLSGLQKDAITKGVSILKAKAEELDGATPRVDVVFEGGGFDEGLARSRILDNPKRKLIKPLSKFLGMLLKELQACALDWHASELLNKGAVSFVNSTVSTANQFLTIVAGINSVLNFGTAAQGPKMAEQVSSCGFGCRGCEGRSAHEFLCFGMCFEGWR